MNPSTRNLLGWVIAIFPISFLFGCINVIKFLTSLTANLIEERHITGVPAPTKFLLANAGLAPAIPVLMSLAFGASLWWIAKRLKDEADRLTWTLLAHTAVWFAGILYFMGVWMAAMLPAFIVNR